MKYHKGLASENIEGSQPLVHFVDNNRECTNFLAKRISLFARDLLPARTAHNPIPLINPEFDSVRRGTAHLNAPKTAFKALSHQHSFRELVNADRTRLPRLL
jgi:hypothetical protein